MTDILHLVADLSKVCPNGCGLPNTTPDHGTVQHILNIVFGLAAALALLMMTVSGLRYIVSAGNPEKSSRARDGLIYSLVGLTIALTAVFLVNFVLKRV